MQLYVSPFSSPSAQSSFLPAIPASALSPLPLQVRQGPEPQIDCPTCILSILRNAPSLGDLPSDGRTMLEELLALCVKYKLITDPLSLEKRQLNQAVSQKKADFIALCQTRQINLPMDNSSGVPILFHMINEEAGKHVSNILLFRKQELVNNCRRDVDISHLSLRDFEQLHAKCSEEMQLINQVKTKITNLIALAKLPGSIKDCYNIKIVHSGNSHVPFIFTTDYLPMGYSIHDLLFGLNIRGGSYEGAEKFCLNSEELKKLNQHLSNLILWADDFTLIMGDLIGDIDKAKDYISLGQKPISEIMRNPIRMGEGVIRELPLYQNMPCLLFNQLSLNLTDHPERDFLKARFIDFFRIENMIGSNGLPKDFLHDSPYQTVLNVEQVMKICPRLNKLLKFQQLVKAFTGTNSLLQALNALKEYGLPNELESMKQYKVGVLLEMYQSILGHVTLSNLFGYLDQNLNVCLTIDTLEGKSLELCEALLKEWTGPFFRRNEASFTPTVEEIRALYDGDRFKTYSGNQQHKNVSKLFSKLRESASFREALAKNPDLTSSVSELEAEFEHRLNGYHALSSDNVYYGRPMIDEAIAHWENYVAKIVYKAQSKVTQDSIERSLIVLAGRNGADLSDGCTRGFAGRINDILIALTTSVGNDLKDHMAQFRKDCLEAIYQEVSYYRDNPESSMAITDKAEAGKFLGILDTNERKRFNELPERVVRILQHYFVRYNSVSIYHKARTFFADKFWQLNKDNDDEGIYLLFEKLGFGNNHAELDKKYRVNGDPLKKWQYAYFQQDLPQYLVPFLVREGILFIKPNQSPEAMFQKEGEQLCTLPTSLPMDYSSSFRPALLSNEEILERARQSARTEDTLNPGRRVGQVLTSQLPEYQPSTS